MLAGQLACLGVLLFGSLALWLSGRSVQREATAFRPVLLDIEKDLAPIMELERTSSGKLSSAEMLKQMEGVDPTKVLAGMQKINSATLKSFWLPSSWPSDLDDRMNRMLILTFNKIVLGSIYLELNQRLQQTLEMEPPVPPTDKAPHVTNVAAMPEFQTLKRFIDHMKELEEYTNMYNFEAMPDSGDLPTLGKLVKYIYGTDLPPAFYQHSDFYFRALKASQQEVIDIDKLKGKVSDKQAELGQKFFDALLERVNRRSLSLTSFRRNSTPSCQGTHDGEQRS